MRTKTEEEKELSKELSSCMLGHYKYCAAAMLMGLPLSIHRKSYWPVALAAVGGTAADFMEGNKNCRPQREALLACIARNEAGEAAKVQPQENEVARDTPPNEEWAQRQLTWEDKGWDETANSTGDPGAQGEGKYKW